MNAIMPLGAGNSGPGGPRSGYGKPMSVERPDYGPDPGVRRHDDLPPHEAVVAAWGEEGPNAFWHRRARMVVRQAMPELARALDRAAAQRTAT